MKKIYYKILENGVELYNLKKATTDSAGFDLVAAINKKIILKPNSTTLIPTGFSIQLPKGFEAQVRPRSGLALKNSITVLNTPGTIDADYRGEVCVILINHGKKKFEIIKGMRIAQIVFMELPKIKLEKRQALSKTKRGKGGFGSTGT
ncbi:MAG: dUTP diphosphatase [Alphaproteobacteria bacterium]|nr:dUTP diphosphatase [Alphaproteobacteria bacterium]